MAIAAGADITAADRRCCGGACLYISRTVVYNQSYKS